ncbi:unnamed protein product [Discosporangium mesarthrocarpum]
MAVKKSRVQQLAEKEEAEKMAMAEEKKRKLEEEEAAKKLMLTKPKSKVEEVTDLLEGMLTERLELGRNVLVLLHRAHSKVDENNSHLKALSDPALRPSEQEERHDLLFRERQQQLEDLKRSIDEAELRMVSVQTRVDEIRGTRETAGGNGDTEWSPYVDEESGLWYWYNERTGDICYDQAE